MYGIAPTNGDERFVRKWAPNRVSLPNCPSPLIPSPVIITLYGSPSFCLEHTSYDPKTPLCNLKL